MTQTQTLARMKKPFGTAKMVDLTAVRYLAWEDAFEVDFKDGLTFLESHASIRKANKISAKSGVEKVEYNTGEVADVSRAFIRELPPRNQK